MEPAERTRVRIFGEIEITPEEGETILLQGAEMTRLGSRVTLRLEGSLGDLRRLVALVPSVGPVVAELARVDPDLLTALTLEATPEQAERLAQAESASEDSPWEEPAWLGTLLTLGGYEAQFAGLVLAEG